MDHEGGPERMAQSAEGAHVAPAARPPQRVPHRAAEARPEPGVVFFRFQAALGGHVGCLLRGEDGGCGDGGDGEGFGAGVGWEVDVWDRGVREGARFRVGEEENGGEGGDLRYVSYC